MLEGDMESSNDTRSAAVSIRVTDVSCYRIESPVVADSGTLWPKVWVRNPGTERVGSIDVKFVAYSAGFPVFQPPARTIGPLPRGDEVPVEFDSWPQVPRGSYETRCWTILPGDLNPHNDTSVGACTVQVRDVGAVKIGMPPFLDRGEKFTPACVLRNFGTTAESYQVRLRIGDFYSYAVLVDGHRAGTDTAVSFPDTNFTQPGSHPVACSTELAGDRVPANDRKTVTVTVRSHDVELDRVLVPIGVYDSADFTIPAVSVRNSGNFIAESVFVRCSIRALGYSRTVMLPAIDSARSATVTFDTCWLTTSGTHAVACSTWFSRDQNPDNNHRMLEFRIAPTPNVVLGQPDSSKVIDRTRAPDIGFSWQPRDTVVRWQYVFELWRGDTLTRDSLSPPVAKPASERSHSTGTSGMKLGLYYWRVGVVVAPLPGRAGDTIWNVAGLRRLWLDENLPESTATAEFFNFPNPFDTRSGTMFRFIQLADIDSAWVSVYNTAGELVWRATFPSGNRDQVQRLDWYGRDATGRRLASGMYLAVFSAQTATGEVETSRQRIAIWPARKEGR